MGTLRPSAQVRAAEAMATLVANQRIRRKRYMSLSAVVSLSRVFLSLAEVSRFFRSSTDFTVDSHGGGHAPSPLSRPTPIKK